MEKKPKTFHKIQNFGLFSIAPCRPLTHHQGDLQQGRQLVLVLNGRLWVDEASLVGEDAVGADEDLLRHRLTENLHLQGVCQDLLRLLRAERGFTVTSGQLAQDTSGHGGRYSGSHPVEVGVDQRHVVVAGDDVAERRQPLLHPLHLDGLRQAVSDVLQLLVRRVVGHQEAMTVPWSQDKHGGQEGVRGQRQGPARFRFVPKTRPGRRLTHTHPPDDATAGQRGVDHRDGFRQLPLEDAAVTHKMDVSQLGRTSSSSSHR